MRHSPSPINGWSRLVHQPPTVHRQSRSIRINNHPPMNIFYQLAHYFSALIRWSRMWPSLPSLVQQCHKRLIFSLLHQVSQPIWLNWERHWSPVVSVKPYTSIQNSIRLISMKTISMHLFVRFYRTMMIMSIVHLPRRLVLYVLLSNLPSKFISEYQWSIGAHRWSST